VHLRSVVPCRAFDDDGGAPTAPKDNDSRLIGIGCVDDVVVSAGNQDDLFDSGRGRNLLSAVNGPAIALAWPGRAEAGARRPRTYAEIVSDERSVAVERLADLIDGSRVPHPVRAAIDGPDAAGKTVLADELAVALSVRGRHVIRASIDGFHRPRAARYARGEDSAEGYYRDSFDYALLRDVLLEPLGPNGTRAYRHSAFDFRTDTPVDAGLETVSDEAVLVFDGVFLFRPGLVDSWDVKIFVSVSFDETLRRALVRDVDLFGSVTEVERRYRHRYIPGQQLYFAEANPAGAADVILINDDPARPTLVSN
jgi:uridine kinase